MYWVKLTRVYDSKIIYVNLERFDRIEAITGDDGKSMTIISTTLSTTEEDSVEIQVIETPEEIIPVMES